VTNGTDPLGEEARAEAWRDDVRARIAYQLDVWAGLQAPPEPRQAVLDGQMALILWQAERDAGPTDPEDDP
jgi:hypothetical protein